MMTRHRTKYSTTFFAILAICLIVIFSNCGKDGQYIKLKKADFKLNLPYSEELSPFGKVKSMKMDSNENLYVLDSEKLFIFKFDSLGNFVSMFGGEGNKCGKLKFPSGIDVYKDSLLIVHEKGSIDILDLNGNCLKYFFVRGFSDMSVAPNGTIVLNRMASSLELDYFIETYDLSGKPLATIGPSRGKKLKNRDADFGFTGFTSDNKIVYVPGFLDSIFVYDFDGNILKRARRAIPQSMTPEMEEKLEFTVEDMCVVNDRIFLLRVDKEKSTEMEIYVNRIAEYNLDLELVHIYELPESITMTTETYAFVPWYHKFLVKDNLFLFMVSKPVEHLVSFTPEN